MFNSIGHNEVVVIPSLNLPPLDNMPRVQILDNVNLRMFRNKKKIKMTHNFQMNYGSMDHYSSTEIMHDTTVNNIRKVSKRNTIAKSKSLNFHYLPTNKEEA